jgi:hypothetical protein
MSNNLSTKLLKTKYLKWVIPGIGLLTFAFIYWFFNPYWNEFFPSCLFYQYTGLKCPICGTQRAIHYLLNFGPIQAVKENALFVLSLPYFLLYAFIEISKPGNARHQKLSAIFFGKKAKIIIASTILLFWLIRNI